MQFGIDDKWITGVLHKCFPYKGAPANDEKKASAADDEGKFWSPSNKAERIIFAVAPIFCLGVKCYEKHKASFKNQDASWDGEEERSVCPW